MFNLMQQGGRQGNPARLQRVKQGVIRFLRVEPLSGLRATPNPLSSVLAR